MGEVRVSPPARVGVAAGVGAAVAVEVASDVGVPGGGMVIVGMIGVEGLPQEAVPTTTRSRQRGRKAFGRFMRSIIERKPLPAAKKNKTRTVTVRVRV
jgi:hypothetical protein